MQTLWPFLFRRPRLPALQSERLELPDGDFLDLVWTTGKNAPLVCLFHGLEGSQDSHYAKGLLNSLAQAGYQVVLMHFRGCSGEPNRLARRYHSGDTDDIRFLLSKLQKDFPQRDLYAVGISLGGNALLKYLGEAQERALIKRAVAVSVPFLLDRSATRLNRGGSRLYQWHLLRALRRSMLAKRALLIDHGIDIEQALQSRSFWEFDNCVTAPLHGFRDVHDYYQQASSRQYLKKIAVPTLIVQARDDPFLTPDAIPNAVELSPQILMEISAHGGHVGFVAGKFPGRATYWLDQRIIRFLNAPPVNAPAPDSPKCKPV